MGTEDLRPFQHDHDAHALLHEHERRTRWVVVITAAMMAAELVAGTIANSLALVADGWHMATHAGALGLSAGAYWFARTRGRASGFSFGTGKVYALAGYTSAVVLAVVALLMLVESARRFARPLPIHFGEALPVAVVGLLVNLASARLLDPHGGPGRHADHDHGRDGRHDHNLRAAYLHVVADAFTSVLAILALLGARFGGWAFLDPAMGVVGAVVILRWSASLCRNAARQLLDVVPSARVAESIRAALEALDDVRVADLHLWDLGLGRLGCIVSLVTARPRETEHYRTAILGEAAIAHLTVEVQRGPEPAQA